MEFALFLSYGSKSYLENRTHYVEVENVKSNPLNVQCGSLWAGSLFEERVKKSREERKRGRACRQTFENAVPRHPLMQADASSYWQEHLLLTGLIDIAFLVGT